MAKITGQVVYVYPTQQLQSKTTGNQFTKRDFVIAVQTFDRDTGEPTIDTENTPQLTITGDRCSQLDNIQKGQMVSVSYSLRGRRYRGDDNKERIITDINVSSVTPIGEQRQWSPQPTQQPQPVQGVQEGNKEGEIDDLLF